MKIKSASDSDQSRLTLILGAPRSGTTWLAKIFDSHPDVLYRHEPDLVVPDNRIPSICADENAPELIEAARGFVADLMHTHTLKTAGSLPVFPKRHDRPWTRVGRTAAIVSLRLVQKTIGLDPRRRIVFLDHFDRDNDPSSHVVLKSISALGRAGLFAEALPEARIILIMRHPFGQIASRLDGLARGKLLDARPFKELTSIPEARRFGLSDERLRNLPPVEQMAWEWAILHEKAYADLSGRPNATMLRYADLVADPLALARALFAFAGLPWHVATERFIRTSTSYGGPDWYFDVRKQGLTPLHKWRKILSAADQARIAAIVRNTSVGQLWPDYFSAPERATPLWPTEVRLQAGASAP